MKTTRAAKRACRARGRAITPCIAPLMKRKASGHLHIDLEEVIDWVSEGQYLRGFCLVERAKGIVGVRW